MTEHYGADTSLGFFGPAAEHIEHCGFGDVGEVDQHAYAVHFLNKSLASRREAIPERGSGDYARGVFDQRGISEGVVAVVRQGCVFDTEGMVEAEVGEGVADLVEAFYADWGYYTFVIRESGQGGRAVELWGRKDGRVRLCQPLDKVQLG